MEQGISIDEAIEMLTARSRPRHQYYDQKELPAIKLGIEALRQIQHLRDYGDIPELFPLPGEIKE